MEPEAIFVRLLFRNVPWTPIQAGLARENEKASSKRDIKPPRNEEFVMEMKGITLYTSPPCKQDLPARNGLRGNLSHARNGRGIKFSFPILSPASKKKTELHFTRTNSSYLRSRSTRILHKNSIFLSPISSPSGQGWAIHAGLALRYRPKRKDNFRIV